MPIKTMFKNSQQIYVQCHIIAINDDQQNNIKVNNNYFLHRQGNRIYIIVKLHFLSKAAELQYT